MLAAAARLKQAGVLVYAIGVGQAGAPDPADRIDALLLASVASTPRMYYGAADAESVAAIYGEIARTIPCAVEGFWGRR